MFHYISVILLIYSIQLRLLMNGFMLSYYLLCLPNHLHCDFLATLGSWWSFPERQLNGVKKTVGKVSFPVWKSIYDTIYNLIIFKCRFFIGYFSHSGFQLRRIKFPVPHIVNFPLTGPTTSPPNLNTQFYDKVHRSRMTIWIPFQ